MGAWDNCCCLWPACCTAVTLLLKAVLTEYRAEQQLVSFRELLSVAEVPL